MATQSSSFLRLFCYVRGDTPNNVFSINIRREKTVAELKKAIKEEPDNETFRGVGAELLVLWMVSLPITPTIGDDVEKLQLVDDDSLLPIIVLSKLFSSAPADEHVHIVIKRPPSSMQQDRSRGHPMEQAHQKLIHNVKSALTPSNISNSATLFKNEQSDHPIYNGRPIERKGPPLSIYHEAFAIIQDALENLDALADPQEETRVVSTAKLCMAATEIYPTEADRLQAVQPFIESLLGIQLGSNVTILGRGREMTQADEAVLQDVEDNDEKAIVSHFKWNSELGIWGQCELQNALSLRKRLIKPQYDRIRNVTCCPCITVSVAGPYISFGGAIFADIFVVEQFTDFIYLGGTESKMLTLSRAFAAVASGIEMLKQYYWTLKLNLQDQLNLARLFPRPTYFPGKDPSSTLVFSGRFDYKGREPRNYRRSIFEGAYNGKKVLVKFCESYHREAHRALADARYAPTLFFCEKLRGGMMMVVMELINGEDAHHHFQGKDLPSDILDQVKSALDILHRRDLVFGDLHRSNIMLKEIQNEGLHALLIDFDWVGLADQERYPPFLNESGEIARPNGVRPHGLMKTEHDLEMIGLLNSSIKCD